MSAYTFSITSGIKPDKYSGIVVVPFPEAKIKYRIRKKKNTPNRHKALFPFNPYVHYQYAYSVGESSENININYPNQRTEETGQRGDK
jgi:hypothetical protein